MYKKIFNISERLSIYNEFDFIRFILASLVVSQHCSVIFRVDNFLNFNSIPAVPIFIFISGLFISESFIFSESKKSYFIKRIRRILPAYIFIVIFGGLLVYLTNIFINDFKFLSIFYLLKYYFFNLLFLNFKFPCIENLNSINNINDCAVNGSLWTIKFEILFYLTLPLLMFFGKIHKKRFFHFITIISLLILGIFNNISIYLEILLCFLIGVGFSMTRESWSSFLKNIKIYSYFRLIIVLTLIILSGGIIPLFIILPLLLLASFLPTVDNSKDLRISKYGDLSYGIYLIHFPIIRILDYSKISEISSKYFLMTSVYLLSIIGAFFLYWMIERKFLNKNSYYFKTKI